MVREPHQWKRKTQVVLGVVRVLMGVDRAVLGVVRIALGVVRLIQGVVSGVGELSSYLGSCARCSGSCSHFSRRCPRCPCVYEFLIGPCGTWGLLALIDMCMCISQHPLFCEPQDAEVVGRRALVAGATGSC